jgi:signal peptidase I
MIRKCIGIAATVLAGGLLILSFTTNHSYVTTPSMYPTIPPGSEIFVSRQADYHVGDVIEFHANGLIWAHRLIEIKPNGDYVTKGDNPQNTPDVFVPPVTKKDVVGAVTHAPKWLGFPELILHRPQYGLSWLRAELGLPGRIVLIVAAALAGLAWPAKAPTLMMDRSDLAALRQLLDA